MHDRPRLSLLHRVDTLPRNPCGPKISGRRDARRRSQSIVDSHPAVSVDLTGEPDAPVSDARAAVDRLLGDILSSACDVVSAERSFLLVSRDERSVEVCASHRIHPSEIVQIAFTRAAPALRRTFADACVSLIDAEGTDLPLPSARQTCSPKLICIPIESALRVSGVLCLERGRKSKQLGELDLEILQALAAQAGNALAAVRTHDALSRLSATLDADQPAP